MRKAIEAGVAKGIWRFVMGAALLGSLLVYCTMLDATKQDMPTPPSYDLTAPEWVMLKNDCWAPQLDDDMVIGVVFERDARVGPEYSENTRIVGLAIDAANNEKGSKDWHVHTFCVKVVS